MMMNKKQSSQVQVSRYLLILPMVMVLTLLFTISKAQLEYKSLNQLKKNGMTAIKSVVLSVSSIPEVITKANRTLTKDDKPLKTEVTSEIMDTSPENQAEDKQADLTTIADKGTPVADTTGHPIMRVRGSGPITKSDNTPLIIVDGIVTPNALSSLNPDDIYSMEVLRDSYAANTVFGKNAASGVVIVTTKKNRDVLFDGVKSGARFVVINGKTATAGQTDQLTMDKINYIVFVIDKDALKPFGEKGTNGALWVVTK